MIFEGLSSDIFCDISLGTPPVTSGSLAGAPRNIFSFERLETQGYFRHCDRKTVKFGYHVPQGCEREEIDPRKKL